MKINVYANMALWIYEAKRFQLGNENCLVLYFIADGGLADVSDIKVYIDGESASVEDIVEINHGYKGFARFNSKTVETVYICSYKKADVEVSCDESTLLNLSNQTHNECLKRICSKHVFPEAYEHCWICQCGFANGNSTRTCMDCGIQKDEIDKIISDGFSRYAADEYYTREGFDSFVKKNGTGLGIDEVCTKYIDEAAGNFSDAEEFSRDVFDNRIRSKVAGEGQYFEDNRKQRQRNTAVIAAKIAVVAVIFAVCVGSPIREMMSESSGESSAKINTKSAADEYIADEYTFEDDLDIAEYLGKTYMGQELDDGTLSIDYDDTDYVTAASMFGIDGGRGFLEDDGVVNAFFFESDSEIDLEKFHEIVEAMTEYYGNYTWETGDSDLLDDKEWYIWLISSTQVSSYDTITACVENDGSMVILWSVD